MATYLDTINSVLSRLRESSVATPTESAYSTLIGEFVNETKEEVENAWKWSALRSTKTVTTAAGTTQYAITGATKRFRLQDKILSVYDATNLARLRRRHTVWMKQQLIINTDQSKPFYYYFEGFDSSGDPYVNFYNIPDGTYTINFDLIVPQADLSTGSTEISVPSQPIKLGAYAKAIAERGEDDGRTHGEALNKYTVSLGDAIAIDESLSLDETTWYA
jgi:hypothetical protein